MRNLESGGESIRSGGRNTTSSENDVSLVQRRQRSARIRSGNDAFDGLEGPERASHHSRKQRMIISTSGFKKSRRKGRSLRQANLPQKKLRPVRWHFLCGLLMLTSCDLVYTTPAPEYPPPQGFQSRSVLWDCVHRICATKGLFLHRQ